VGPIAKTNSTTGLSTGEWNSLQFYSKGMDFLKNSEFLNPNIKSAVAYFSAASQLGYREVTHLLSKNEGEWKRYLSDNPMHAEMYWQQAVEAGLRLAKQHG